MCCAFFNFLLPSLMRSGFSLMSRNIYVCLGAFFLKRFIESFFFNLQRIVTRRGNIISREKQTPSYDPRLKQLCIIIESLLALPRMLHRGPVRIRTPLIDPVNNLIKMHARVSRCVVFFHSGLSLTSCAAAHQALKI